MSGDAWDAVSVPTGGAPAATAEPAAAPASPWDAVSISAAEGRVPLQAQTPEVALPAAPAPDGGPAKPGYFERIAQQVAGAAKQYGADVKTDYEKSTVNRLPANPVDAVLQTGADVGRKLGLLKDAIAIPGAAFSAAVAEPGADLLDKLPAPQATHVEWHGLIPHMYNDGAMTPEQQHAANVDAINTALMGLGPKGIKAGAVGETGSVLADANAAKYTAKVAKVVNAVPPEVALDPAGNLTPEAREHAMRAGVHPEDLQTGYQAAKQAAERPAAPQGAASPDSAPGPAPEAGAGPSDAAPSSSDLPPDPNAPTTAQDRLAEARSAGIDLSKGQATQDFEAQAKESDLKATNGPANEWFANQQRQIGAAVDSFKQAFGEPEMSAADRGQMVKDAIGQLRDNGNAGVTALYQRARDLAESLGGAGSNILNLDTQPLLEGMRQLWSDESVPDRVRNTLKQQAAKYGLIGESPQTVEGETTVTLRNSQGEPAGKVSFIGKQEPLTILNAEDLRQKINQLYEADDTKQSQALKGIIDNAVQQAVERAASNDNADIGKAFKEARQAYVQQQQTFKAKDIVQQLIDWKKGTEVRDASGKVVAGTPTILPEDVPRKVLAGGKEAETNLKKIKALLLSKPTEASRAAWQAIRSQAIGEIFDQAFVTNANLGGGQVGAISGAKLNTAIAKFGVGKLKILLDPNEFNQLMKLRRIIETATVPISGTANPSGTGGVIGRLLQSHGVSIVGKGLKFIPGMREIQHVGEAVHGLYKVGADHAEAGKTLKGITEFDAEAAAAVDKKKP